MKGSYLCDRCKTEIKCGGYLVNKQTIPGGLSAMVVIAGNGFEPEAFDLHFCGKACLMLEMSEMVDALTPLKGYEEPAALCDVRERMRR